MQLTLADFEGAWFIDRVIDDRLAARTGKLLGQVTFKPQGRGMLYHEVGVLRFPDQPELNAQQSYLWRSDGNAIAVHFADGRPFHRIALNVDTPEASHDCAPDIYHGSYDFSAWPNWTARWHVSGPRKDYKMTTDYRR